MPCYFSSAGRMIICQWEFCQSTSLACLGDEDFLACTSPMRRFFTAGPLFIMMVELSAEGWVLNLADFSSTRRWTWFCSLFTSVFLRQLGTSACPEFKLQAYSRVLAGDVPWTCDSDGHPLVNFSCSARSSIYFLLMNLWYQASRGTNFKSGVSNFCVVAFRVRMKHFATIFRGGSNFWSRRCLDFLLKVPSTLSIVDPVELSTIHTLRSPPDFNLWDLTNFLNQQSGPERHFEWNGHCLIRRDLHNFLMQPGMMDTWIHPQAFLHFLSPSARQLMLR